MPTFSEKPPFRRGLPEDWDPRLPWPAELIERALRDVAPDLDVYTHWYKVFEPRFDHHFSGDQYAHLYDAGLFPFKASVDVEISYGGGAVDIVYEKVLWEKMDQEVHDPEIRGNYAPMVLEALKRLKKQQKGRRQTQRRLDQIDAAIAVVELAIRKNKKAGYKPS